MRVEQTNLKEVIPDYYDSVYEMQELIRQYMLMFENTKVNVQRIQDNASILLCDEESLLLYERMLRIVASQDESIEFRRLRIINRLNNRPPFSLGFLVQKLNDIFGRNQYDIYIDYENYVLNIESSVNSQEWYHEVNYTVNSIKPSNMVYVQVPLYAETIRMIEKGYILKMEYAKVGYARVGITPLESRMNEQEVTLQ